MKHYYHCIKCNKKFYNLQNVCRHNLYYNYIEILYDYKKIKKAPVQKRKKALLTLLPVDDVKFSLGEGNTPLIKLNNFSNICKNNNVYVKNEGQNPTGSFKDRESALVITKASELGYKKIVNISSGNAALSSAVYTNKAKLQCECFIPKDTSKAKKQMLKLYGANFHLVDGDYEIIYRKIVDNPIKKALNVTSGQNCFREEGSKKISYEIWEKINIPDVVIIPIGNGTLFSAIYKGFEELKKIGLTNKIPWLVGVQIKNASPISTAIKKNKDYAILNTAPESIAEGIIARESYDAPKVINIIKNKHGEIMEITEKETILALKNIIKKESLTPEPTSAVVYAALNKFKITNKKKLKIVCVQTGNGMKNLDEILKIT